MSDELIIEAEAPPQPGTNFIVLIALMVLLGLTIGFAFLHIGGKLSLLIALGIASTKAVLILIYFMHLRFSPRLTIAVALAGFVWLGILFLLAFCDYAWR